LLFFVYIDDEDIVIIISSQTLQLNIFHKCPIGQCLKDYFM